VRWQDTLALFNVDIQHKPGKENVVPDALSRKHQLKVVYVGETELQKKARLVSLGLDCQICQRIDDVDHMLFYNNCNGGYHLFRLKSKLTQVPVGIWYCSSCFLITP